MVAALMIKYLRSRRSYGLLHTSLQLPNLVFLELVNTEDFSVSCRRSTQITLYVTVTCLRTGWLHTQSYDTVSFTGKLQCGSNDASELVTIVNDVIRRSHYNIGASIFSLMRQLI